MGVMTFTLAWLLLNLLYDGNGQPQQKNAEKPATKTLVIPDFASPLHIPLSLAANFCEVRKDHYHMGLDIRTQQRENLPVFAVEEGFISRIGISSGGYGNVLYVTHPNGYTSLYAHLNSFYPSLAEYVKQLQYEKESWELDIWLPEGKFPVKKGQFIALSGNTGASAGPHLHFEIRETATGKTINPMQVGFAVKDAIAPAIYSLYYYDRTISTYEQSPRLIPKSGLIKVTTPLISLAIKASDRNNSSSFSMGFYRAEIQQNGKTVFGMEFNGFPHSQTRYVNAAIDYRKWVMDGSQLQHLSRLPGNHHEVYDTTAGDGIIDLSNGAVHEITILIADISNNSSKLQLRFQYDPWQPRNSGYESNIMSQPDAIPLIPNQPNNYTKGNAGIAMSSRAIYDTIPFSLTEKPTTRTDAVSPLIQVGSTLYPVHDEYTVLIKPTQPVNEDKLVMAMQGSHNYAVLVKPEKKGEFFEGRFKKFGLAQLIQDETPPVISGFTGGKKIGNSIRITVTDNLKVLRSFKGYIDGKWVLFKRTGNSYVYFTDEHCPPGPHTLNLYASDIAGNITEKQFSFVR